MKPGTMVRVHSGYFTGKYGKVLKLSRFRQKDHVHLVTCCAMKFDLIIELKNVELCDDHGNRVRKPLSA